MSKKRKKDAVDAVGGYQFGTFQGVFTPSILTILGVIMFLRFGWVLGNVGLAQTLLIVTMATSITFLTGLSLSATATNMKVGQGGAYYMISRSLGLEIGAAIGLPLFLAQALGIAFYISGFAESIEDVVNLTPWIERLPEFMQGISEARFISILTLSGLTLLALISADLALKAQLLILCAIFASLVSFFAGGPPVDNAVLPGVEVPMKVDFWLVFAVFFPAVTGIEAGIAMSGDLKDPAKSLPRGTIAAVLTGYVVYMCIPLVLVYYIKDENILLTRPLIMAEIARWAILIMVGVWAATLSSALGALLGAPRTLQALANDRVLPRFIGKGYGKKKDPRIATAISFAVAMLAILLGDLNMIAPVLTMFFLTSYGLINLSAGLEGLIESPTWRPKFRFPWWGSLIGAMACFTTMIMIDIGASIAALFVTSCLYVVMKRRKIRSRWGDTRSGVLMLLVRFAIERLLNRPTDERNWRPNVLVFSGSPQSRWHLIELAQALARGTSYLTLATIVPSENWTSERVISLRKSITDYLQKRNVDAMVKLFPSKEILPGAEALVKGYGFGPIEPNTIVMGETRRPEQIPAYTNFIQLCYKMKRNLIMVRTLDEESELPTQPRIDIWWRGQQANIGLMLTSAYLLTRGGRWANARIVLKRMIKDESERKDIMLYLQQFKEEHRLNLELEVLIADLPKPLEMIHRSSADASLVLIGMMQPQPDDDPEVYQNYYRKMLEDTAGLPLVLVLSAENINFTEIIGMG
ncbi:amino acid permease [Kiritimatiellota bacterium B12222]|nr:amino acid permease [Kiritimatiellota bacterium B12222]